MKTSQANVKFKSMAKHIKTAGHKQLPHSPGRSAFVLVALDLCEVKLSDGPASVRTGLPTAAMVSDLGARVTGLGGTAGDLFLS